MDLLAGAFIEPSGRGFDFDVRAEGVGFSVEVLKQNREAVFPVLQDVLEPPSPSRLEPEGNFLDGNGGVVPGFVFGGDVGQDFGFQASLEELAHRVGAGPEDIDVFQVHLLAIRTDKKVPFSDFAGVYIQSFEVFDFHLWLTVVLCGEKSTSVVFYETCYKWGNFRVRKQKVNEDYLEALNQVFPQFSFWIMTWQTIPEAGQISPEMEKARKENSLKTG